MTKLQKNLITIGIVFIALASAAKYTLPSIMGSLSTVQNLREQVAGKDDIIASVKKANAEWKEKYDNMTTTTTTDRKKLQAQVDSLTKGNDSLKTLVGNLQGQLTSVGHIHGTIDIGDTATAVVKDSTASIRDPFVDINYNLISKRFKWGLQAYINAFVIEKTDEYGNRHQVVRTFLKSMRADTTFEIPCTAEFTSYKEKIHLWHLWNPRLQSSVLLASPMRYNLSMSLASFGVNKFAEGTYFYFLSPGISTDFKNDLSLSVAPITYNLGTVLPLVTNFNISGVLTYSLSKPGQLGVFLGIGITH